MDTNVTKVACLFGWMDGRVERCEIIVDKNNRKISKTRGITLTRIVFDVASTADLPQALCSITSF